MKMLEAYKQGLDKQIRSIRPGITDKQVNQIIERHLELRKYGIKEMSNNA